MQQAPGGGQGSYPHHTAVSHQPVDTNKQNIQMRTKNISFIFVIMLVKLTCNFIKQRDASNMTKTIILSPLLQVICPTVCGI